MSGLPWKKSTHSEVSQCVEAARGVNRVHVRDSVDPDGPILHFSPDEWSRLMRRLKEG